MFDTGLNWFLESNSALAALLGRGGSPVRARKDRTTGIYPGQALGQPDPPYIVWLQISSTPNNVMEGVNRFQNVRIRFSCTGSDYTQAKQLARTLKLQLQGFKGLWYSTANPSEAQVDVQGAWEVFWGDNAEPDAHATLFTSVIDFSINFVDMRD